jgi:acetoin utilization deacetylase AcuC-like enzyme
MGGYCYFNNGGVAAQILRNASRKNRIAILDVDFHHGNGTEKIFGETEEILTVSIHADPSEKFPFFSGSETDAYLSNRNFPLPLGTANTEYHKTLLLALEVIKQHRASHLVVCFGADTHESDPIGGFKLTTDFYTKMSHLISELKIPTVVIQEGGYNTAALGENVLAFLDGFEEPHRL